MNAKRKVKRKGVLATVVILFPSLILMIFLVLFSLLTVMCSNPVYEPGSRGICERCNSDSDCKPGLKCKAFFGNGIGVEMCATSSTRTCKLSKIGNEQSKEYALLKSN